MKMLRNKKAIHKIMISLIILILFNFIFPVYSRGADWGEFGGAIFNPISKLICGLGDSLIVFLQDQFLPGSPEAVAKKRPIDFITEQMSDNVNNIIEKQVARYATGTPVTDEEREQMENELKLALEAREANEKASYITSGDFLLGLGGLIAQNYDSEKYSEQVIPCIVYSPAAIFANMVPALDANFINPDVIYAGGTVNYVLDSNNQIKVESYSPIPTVTQGVDDSNSAHVLQSTIATWYKALRNIAIVGLLSVLVYIAIRIILSTAAGETAKYKSMLKDWLVAMCILLFMHYMMAFLLKSSEMLTNLFISNGVIAEKVEDLEIDTYISNIRCEVENYSGNLGMQFGYTVMYVLLIFYTFMFTWKYIKRLIYLAFLTLMSPMVALTYPIDKIKDGSAQAFNMWFKEYMFNVLIQPIHMLLYTVLISSASSLASKNILYAVVALGFMLEAEKIIKDFFKIQTQKGEGAGAITGGAMFGAAAGLMNKGLGALPSSSSGKDSGGSGKSGGGKPRFNDRDSDSDGANPFKSFISDENQSGGIETVESDNDSSDDSSDSGDASDLGDSSAPKYNTGLFRGLSKGAGFIGGGIKRGASAIGKGVQSGASTVGKGIKRGTSAVGNGIRSSANALGKTKTIKGIKKIGSGIGKGASTVGRGLGKAGKTAVNLGSDIMKSPAGKVLRFTGRAGVTAAALAGKFGLRALGVGGRTILGAANIVKRNGGRVTRFVGRTALKGVGAATLGTIGLAAGLASGNDADILKYGGLGVTAGWVAGGKVSKSAGALYGNIKNGGENLAEDFAQGYYGKDFEEKVLNPRLDKEWMNDKDVQAYYERKYGWGYRRKMKESLEIRKAGITNQDDIDTALKLVEKNPGVTTKNAAEIMKFTKRASASDLWNSERWENMYKEATKLAGGNEEQGKRIMSLINQRFKFSADWRPSSKKKNEDEQENT